MENGALEIAFELLTAFQESRRADTYRLMRTEQIEAGQEKLAAAFAQVTGIKPPTIAYISCEGISWKTPCDPDDPDAKKRKTRQLYELDEKVEQEALVNLFKTPKYRDFAERRVKPRDQRLLTIIKGAIGTRRLTRPLDNTFGNSFTKPGKRIIVATWTTYLMAHVPSRPGLELDIARIEASKHLVEHLTQGLLAYYEPGNPGTLGVLTA